MEQEYRPLIPPKYKSGRPNRIRPHLAKKMRKSDNPRSLLTPDVHKKIVDAVKTGAHENVAAQYAGVAPKTLYSWLSMGRGPAGHFKRNERYQVLAAEIDQARAAAEFQAVLYWRSAMAKDWHAAQKFLEVTVPERWKPKSDIERLSQPSISISMQQGLINSPQIQPDKKSLLQMIEDNPTLFSPTMQAINAALSTIEGEYQDVSAESPPGQYNDELIDINRLLPSETPRSSTIEDAEYEVDEE